MAQHVCCLRSWGFPFHQGRFQGPQLGQCFIIPYEFPFHQGRFQGAPSEVSTPSIAYFHSTKEGFKVGATGTPSGIKREISIPPRKVSRYLGRALIVKILDISIPPRKVSRERREGGEGMNLDEFPFHQGRFQGNTPQASGSSRSDISIPPRKVSRLRRSALIMLRRRYFHSTKEGFKVF